MARSALRFSFQLVINFRVRVAADFLSRGGFEGKGPHSRAGEESNEIRRPSVPLLVSSASVDALNTERVNDHHWNGTSPRVLDF